ncbi:MAG: PAS domain-containing protein [Bacteroidota bacterium]
MQASQHSGVAIIMTDPNRRIIWVNQQFTKLTGYHLEEVIGKSPSILQGPNSNPEIIECIHKLLKLGVPFTERIENYRKNGDPYDCLLTVHPIYDTQQKLIAYMALSGDNDHISAEVRAHIMEKKKYSSSNLSKINAIKIYKELKRVFREDAIYKNPRCSLSMMAERLSTNTKYLSQVINTETGLKFRDFLNTYRVNHFKKLIREGLHQNLSIQGMAAECGFKNKMSFYNAVKKITKCSPGSLIQAIDS